MAILFWVLVMTSCQQNKSQSNIINIKDSIIYKVDADFTPLEDKIRKYIVEKPVTLKDYHKYMASLIDSINHNQSFVTNEYVILQFNPSLMKQISSCDYYLQLQDSIVIDDPGKCLAMQEGYEILLPDSLENAKILEDINQTVLDINIPEFMLRIKIRDTVRYSFPVRVGKDKTEFLAMVGGILNLRTKTGVGQIVRINKEPLFINPKDNKKYKVTRRDDNYITKLPNIPWMEPELNGQRFGQLIHPTTNLKTIGRATSNGCIGLRESDAWMVYFHAPLGTKVVVRYDLEVKDENGEIKILDDIYPKSKGPAKPGIVTRIDSNTCICGR